MPIGLDNGLLRQLVNVIPRVSGRLFISDRQPSLMVVEPIPSVEVLDKPEQLTLLIK